MNLTDITKVINMQQKGTRNYKYVVSAIKKLAEVNRRKHIHEELSTLSVIQTVFMDLQSANLEEFINWRIRT